MRFTFKKEPRETGLAAVGNPYPNVVIKLEGKEVGVISGPNWQSADQKWRIRFTVKAENHCGWKWVQLKALQESEQAAREYIKQHTEALLALKLHQLD